MKERPEWCAGCPLWDRVKGCNLRESIFRDLQGKGTKVKNAELSRIKDLAKANLAEVQERCLRNL